LQNEVIVARKKLLIAL